MNTYTALFCPKTSDIVTAPNLIRVEWRSDGENAVRTHVLVADGTVLTYRWTYNSLTEPGWRLWTALERLCTVTARAHHGASFGACGAARCRRGLALPHQHVSEFVALLIELLQGYSTSEAQWLTRATLSQLVAQGWEIGDPAAGLTLENLTRSPPAPALASGALVELHTSPGAWSLGRVVAQSSDGTCTVAWGPPAHRRSVSGVSLQDLREASPQVDVTSTHAVLYVRGTVLAVPLRWGTRAVHVAADDAVTVLTVPEPPADATQVSDGVPDPVADKPTEVFALFKDLPVPGCAPSFSVDRISPDDPDSPDEVPGSRGMPLEVLQTRADQATRDAEEAYAEEDRARRKFCGTAGYWCADCAERLRSAPDTAGCGKAN